MPLSDDDKKVRAVTGRVMTVIAGCVSTEHDRFTGCLVAGLGATLAWLIADEKRLSLRGPL